MTIPRKYKPTIPNIENSCKIELAMPCPSSDNVIIPFGFTATQKKSEPIPDEQTPAFVTLLPHVFKEPTLDKSKSGAPEYLPFIKNQDQLADGEAIGYYYLYVDGYLWREIAALPNGLLSDIDLSKTHDQNFRKYSSKAAIDIIVPRKALGLFNDNASELKEPVIQIAFSRVQWSWEYITCLGGMYQQDPRLALSPLLCKCTDTDLAVQYRIQRMQLVNFSGATDFTTLENLGLSQDGKLSVFVHDIIGLAQKSYLDSAFTLFELMQHNTQLQAEPFYQSAMYAHNFYLNEELTSRKPLSVPKSYHHELKNNDNQSNMARDVGKYLCKDKIESYLVKDVDFVLQKVACYLTQRENLYDLFYLDNTSLALTLDEICIEQNIQAPPDWPALVRDFTTLSALAYPTSLELFFNLLTSLLIPEYLIPVYFPAINNQKPRSDEIKTRLNQRINDDKLLISELLADENSWFNKQLCPNKDLFASDLSAIEPDTDKILQELGAFDPIKLQYNAVKIEFSSSHYIPDKFYPSIMSVDTIKRGFEDALKFYERIFKEQLVPNEDNARFYQMVGAFTKSYDIDKLKGIRLTGFAGVPENHVMLQFDITTHPIMEKISSKKAKTAIKNSLASVRKGRTPNTNQLITIARELQKQLNVTTIHSNMTQPGGELLATQVKDEIVQMLKELVSKEQTYRSVMGVGVKTLSVPYKHVPATAVYEYNSIIDEELQHTALDPNKIQKVIFEGTRGFTAALAALSTVTAYFIYAEYDKNFKGKQKGEIYAKHFATLGSVIASTGNVWEVYYRPSKTHFLVKSRIPAVADSLSEKLNKPVKFTVLRSFGGLTGIVGGGLQIADGFELLSKQDKDAAVASFFAGSLAVASAFYGAVFLTMGPIGWGLFIGSIIMTLVASKLTDTLAQKWAKFGPFAKKPKGFFAGDKNPPFSQFQHSSQYLNYLMSVLFSPKVSTIAVGDDAYVVHIDLTLFDKTQSEIELVVPYTWWDPIKTEYFSGQWLRGTKVYKSSYNQADQLIRASYYFKIDSGAGSVTKITPSAILRYDQNLTFPLDYNQFEKPALN